MASIITPYGLGKIAEAALNDTPLNVTGIEIGNGPAITAGSAVGIGGASMYTIPQQDITVTLDTTSDPNHPTIRAEGTIPSTISGGFTISSIALKDGNNVIAVVDGLGDTMNGAESVNPQAYSVLFLLPLSSTENFSIIMGAGVSGNYLPLAGGTMDDGAEIELVESVGSGSGQYVTKTKIRGNGIDVGGAVVCESYGGNAGSYIHNKVTMGSLAVTVLSGFYSQFLDKNAEGEYRIVPVFAIGPTGVTCALRVECRVRAGSGNSAPVDPSIPFGNWQLLGTLVMQ
jgi:hypothetical protein